MSRCAAPRIASRVVLPSRVLAVGLGVSVGVLVVVICTNRSVQKATPREAPRQARDRLPEIKGQTRGTPTGNEERRRRESGIAERPGAAGEPGTEERHGSAGTLRAARGLRGPFEAPLEEPKSVTAPPGRSEPPGG